jgi:threonine/homoserine/homoserine lactone efflux protein
MDWTSLLTYMAVLAAAAAVPGPDIAAIVARALAGGFARTLGFISGIVFGHAIWTLAAALGLVALVHALGPIFVAVKIAAACYLIYLAWGLWTSPVNDLAASKSENVAHGGGFLPGLLVSLSNPKALIFFGAVMPSVLPIGALSLLQLCIVIAVSSVTMFGVFGVWGILAARARRLLRSASARRALNRSSAVVMAGAGVAIAAR